MENTMHKVMLSPSARIFAVLIMAASLCGCDDGKREPIDDSARTGDVRPILQLDEIDRAAKDIAATNAEATASQPAAVPKPAPVTETKSAPPPVPQEQPAGKEKEEPPFLVANVSNSDLSRISIEFSTRPDLSVINEYVKISPDPGPRTFDWWYWQHDCKIACTLKPCTEYTVTVRSGLPDVKGRTLAKEFRRTFKTGHRRKSVEFAAEGRYLPSTGSRMIAVKSVNVTNLEYSVRNVMPRNIVQMLARENEEYACYYGGSADTHRTIELANAPHLERTVRVMAPVDTEATSPILVTPKTAQNGVYLVGAGEKGESNWSLNWRLVCVTDIGLSVRKIGNNVYVWATSLVRGTALADIKVSVYGSNNLVLSEGVTDADGWCCCEFAGPISPFAVVAESNDGSDVSFLAMSGLGLDENPKGGDRASFVPSDGSEAFVWTDRGIYRHGEDILLHALVRDGKGNAPKPFPVTIVQYDPEGKEFRKVTRKTDRFGRIAVSDFTVPDDQPGGWWKFEVCIPGRDLLTIGERKVKIEEFVPPQIRVKVSPPPDGATTNELKFAVEAEHLFGAPARGLIAEGAYRLEDAAFTPRGWEAFRFGDGDRCVMPNFTHLDKQRLDTAGKTEFAVTIPKNVRPSAAVKLTVQGSVFEEGGRCASARGSSTLHLYPFYIGAMLPKVVRLSSGSRKVRLALVDHQGVPYRGERELDASILRIDRVYGLKRNENGFHEWKTDLIRVPVVSDLKVKFAANGSGVVEVPCDVTGEYVLKVADEASGASLGVVYRVCGADEAETTADLDNPASITMACDREIYHPGDRPRLTIRSPFAGLALVTVLRDDLVYSQVMTLTNATSEIELEPVTAQWAPSVDVCVSVVQAAVGKPRHVTNRARGVLALRCATPDSALKVEVAANVKCAAEGGATVDVKIDARSAAAVGEIALVTLTDEGIHMLTNEPEPDPIGWFGRSRESYHPFFDIYDHLLPVLDPDSLRRSGVKTGGGADGDLFRRLSPMPSRRFRPLSLWNCEVPLKDGVGTTSFTLPEFVGEVRVTAVAANRRAVGADSVHAKVQPAVVMQPDAPRFAAPGDRFDAVLPLTNCSGRKGRIAYDVMVSGSAALSGPVHGEIELGNGDSRTLTIPVVAAAEPGEATIIFVSEGFGEKHRAEIKLPVRPAVPWVKTAGVVELHPGEEKEFANEGGLCPDAAVRAFAVSSSPLAELASALEWLVAYPHGCLEQTVSRVFPLVAAGGFLNTLPSARTSAADDAKDVVAEGVRRVLSMMHENDFTMWPDVNMPPWDPEVTFWAAQFLIEAKAAGYSIPSSQMNRCLNMMRRKAASTNEVVSVYACHNLALVARPDRDRMLHWYDARAKLSPLDRVRLARAFAKVGDRERAGALLEAFAPSSVKVASFALLMLLETDPADVRIPALVKYIGDRRDKSTSHWGTTAENAHALLALATYYRSRPAPSGRPEVALVGADGRAEPLALKHVRRYVGGGTLKLVNKGAADAFLAWSRLALPAMEEVRPCADGVSIERRFFYLDGKQVDLGAVSRGDAIIVELRLKASEKRDYSDLVIEDLLPACFEADWARNDTLEMLDLKGADSSWWLRADIRDDRLFLYSKKFSAAPDGKTHVFHYQVRAVSSGEFVLPGASVEAMYEPAIRARGESCRVTVKP